MANDQFTSKGKFAENYRQVAKIEVHKVDKGIIVCKWWEGYEDGDSAHMVQKSPRPFEDAREWLEDSGWLIEKISDKCFQAFEYSINPVEGGISEINRK